MIQVFWNAFLSFFIILCWFGNTNRACEFLSTMALVAVVPYLAVASLAFFFAGNFHVGWINIIALKVLLVILTMRLSGSDLFAPEPLGDNGFRITMAIWVFVFMNLSFTLQGQVAMNSVRHSENLRRFRILYHYYKANTWDEELDRPHEYPETAPPFPDWAEPDGDGNYHSEWRKRKPTRLKQKRDTARMFDELANGDAKDDTDLSFPERCL